jgi:lantibiotic modifying enzyme
LESVGAFSGYGGRIWSWLALHDLLQRPELLANALIYAEALEREGFDADIGLDIIDGSCGAIVPLLNLAEATNDSRWLRLATRAGRRLESTAIVDEHGARWPSAAFNEPVGGFAHGTAGIAWALARLALAGAGDEADRRRWSTLAREGLAFQDSLFDESLGNWRERTSGTCNIHTWCGGSVGIGLAATDLYARSGDVHHLRDLRRAVIASQGQWGFSHTLCHGDFSLWDLFARASELDPKSSVVDRNQATAEVVSAIEEHHGMVGGMTRNAFTPGLMTGLAGVIHTLARMHPDCDLPSPLLLERHRRTSRSHRESRSTP